MKKLLSLLLICGLLSASVQLSRASSARISNQDSVMLYYHPGSILLFDTYKTNANALARMERFVSSNRSAILSGQAHLALYGYILSSEVGNKRAVNNASIQASVVRALLKTRYGIPHTYVTFAIDTTQHLSNVVQLQVVDGGIPSYANTEIHYSESRNQASIANAFSQYRNGIPYTSYYMVLAKRNELAMDGSELYAIGDRQQAYDQNDDYADEVYREPAQTPSNQTYYIKRPDGSFMVASSGAMASGTVLYKLSATGNYIPATSQEMLAFAPNKPSATPGYTTQKEGLVRTEPYAEAKGSMAARDYPVVGVKTNVLYWAVAMPNAEVEFFMGKGISLAFEGDYAWLSSALSQDKAYYLWGAGGELRFWFRQNRRFDGFYAGIYGHAGQYDLKFSRVGNQGDYYGGGATFGYVLPLGKSFNIEFGLGLGYIQYKNTQYLWDAASNKNVYNPENPTVQIKNFVGPTKLKVSLLWKF